MVFQLELQNCRAKRSTVDYIDHQAKRLDRYLPTFSKDLPLLHLYIEGHPTKEYFSGSVVLHLPQQALSAHFRSRDMDRAVKLGFSKIRRELRNYKGQHFVGNSEYPSREQTFKEESDG